jgi:hypothetical protein
MIRRGALLFAAGYALLCAPAFAQGTPPDNEESRFSFFRAEDGYLRLDARTGQVSLCTRRQAGWLCQALPEDRAAFEAEIARLQLENAALKKQVLAHDLPLPREATPQPPPPADREVNQITSVISVIENVWRRLVAMIQSVQRDLLRKS